MRGRKPIPRGDGQDTPSLGALPRCPAHLSETARREWRRLAAPLHNAGLLTLADRGALSAYCQSYGRWVEAEERLRETPMLIKSPSGYAQQSPWLSIANKQLELMGRYMSELGLTPVARTRLVLELRNGIQPQPSIEFVTIYTDKNGDRVEKPLDQPRTASGTVHKISWQE